jgi:hypothetical protein
MNIVVLIGGRAGTVQDVPVEYARAMVADGRARWPDGSPHAPPSSDEQRTATSDEKLAANEVEQSVVPAVSVAARHQKHARR